MLRVPQSATIQTSMLVRLLPCSSDSISPITSVPIQVETNLRQPKDILSSFIPLHSSSIAVLAITSTMNARLFKLQAVSVIRLLLLGVQPNICFIHHIEIGGRNIREHPSVYAFLHQEHKLLSAIKLHS